VVTQRKARKPSRRALQAKEKIRTLQTASDRLEFYKANRDAFQEIEAHEIRDYDRKLLLELANLRDDGWQRFSKRFPSDFKDRSMFELRNDLRLIWERTVSDKRSNSILDAWLRWSTQAREPSLVLLPWVPDIRTGRLLPDWQNLPARVVMAVLEHFQRFRKCGNPECAAPFFIAKRTSQRFCELGECTRYAQNQYALKWWKEKGKTRIVGTERSERVTRKTR